MDTWTDPHSAFMWRLKSERLDMFLEDKEFLASLRYDWDQVRYLTDLFKEQLDSRKIALEDEVFRASKLPDPGNCDEEDEQKQACLLPDSTEGWIALEKHREEKRSAQNASCLDVNSTNLVFEFRGPRDPPPPPPPKEEPRDPWDLPVAVPHQPFIRVV